MTNPLSQHTNKEQIRAANPNVSVWANANAGAGKTKVLIDRIARILLSGTEPQKILAVTYTKAAAAEMTTRLFKTLGLWTITDDENLGKILQKLDENIALNDNNLSNARALFARALETPGGLKVQTIHAFCGDILKRFPIEAQIAPGFEVADEGMNKKIRDEAYLKAVKKNSTLFSYIAADTHSDQNKKLLEIVGKNIKNNFTFDEDLLRNIFAKKLGHKIICDIDGAIDEALSTIPTQLIGELKHILEAELDNRNNKSTYPNVCKIISGNNIEAYSAALKLILTDGKLRAGPYISANAKKTQTAINLFGTINKNEDWELGQFAEFYEAAKIIEASKIINSTIKLLHGAYLWQNEFKALKQIYGKLDFDDLLHATSNLLNKDEGSALWVMYKLDKGLSHILIDESQDTSAEQWDLLHPMLETLENQTHNENRTQFIVGDDKQSIYRFQGASTERYSKEREIFLEKKMREPKKFDEVKFAVSFRTGDEILKTVDKIWHDGCNKEAKIDQALLETKAFAQMFDVANLNRSHFSSRIEENAITELWPIVLNDEKSNEEIAAWDFPIDSESNSDGKTKLAELIACEIANRIKNKMPVWGKDENGKPKLRPVIPSDFMILVKSRNALFHRIIKRLKRQSVKVAGADLIVLSKEAVILDLLMLAQFALCPNDDFNTACVLKSAFCGLYDDDAHLLPLCHNRDKSVWNMLLQSEDEIYKIPKLVLQNVLIIGATHSPFEFFAKVLDTKIDGVNCGWQILLKRFGEEAQEPIEILLDIALNSQSLEIANLIEFIDYIANRASDVKREFDQNEDGVKVMTIHGAKGREAPVVILPDTTRALPNSKDNLYFDPELNLHLWAPDCEFKPEFIEVLKDYEKRQSIEEDERLLYVAMTRPRDRLILCGHQYKKLYDKNSWYAKFDAHLSNIPTTDEKELFAFDNGAPLLAKIWGQLPNQEFSESILNKENSQNSIPDWNFTEVIEKENNEKIIAPSSLFIDDYEPPSISPISGNVKKRFMRGTLIHELLETLPNFAPNTHHAQATKRLMREIGLDDNQKQDIINEALKILSHAEYKDIFSSNSRAEVAILGSSKNLPKGIIINGTIDRMIIKDNEILCLDYKTNRPPPENTQNIPVQYIIQMACYRAILQESYPNHKIKCALLWTDTPILMEIDDEAMDISLTYKFN